MKSILSLYCIPLPSNNALNQMNCLLLYQYHNCYVIQHLLCSKPTDPKILKQNPESIRCVRNQDLENCFEFLTISVFLWNSVINYGKILRHEKDLTKKKHFYPNTHYADLFDHLMFV